MGNISEGNDPFAPGKKDKPRRPKGKKITKQDIGLPQDFRWASSRIICRVSCIAVCHLPMNVAKTIMAVGREYLLIIAHYRLNLNLFCPVSV